ncbi:MAG: response regulator [Thermodesulfovibrionales bacterium]
MEDTPFSHISNLHRRFYTTVINNDFDLIITDYKLPDIFGPELTKKIKFMKPFIPVIGISAYPCKKVFIQAGADEFFEKPFRMSDIRQSVETLTIRRDL